jgi:NAD(P)-dependent dehydrogenase (short-subunit alcohol dehydrogenase family)
VTDAASIWAGADFVAAHLGQGPVALVNNAGIFVAGPLEVIPLARFKQQFDVSLFGALAVTQAFLPLIRQRPGGRIINIGSMNGRIPAPFGSAYASAKHALRSMTDALRIELSPWQIGVSLIESGIVVTPMMDKVRAGIHAEPEAWTAQQRAWYEQAYKLIIPAMIRLERMASQPEDVARTVEQALNDRRPRPYYRVGWDAWLAVFMEALLPARLSDWLILKFYGLEKTARRRE